MDDDSLDELGDQSPGPGRHRRLRAAALASDAEESSDGDSEASEDDTGSELGAGSDTGDEEGDLADGSGAEESEDDDDDDVETVAGAQRALEARGAFHSDDEAESCPICLNAFRDQAVGTPQSCAHYFCLDCILEWSKNANSCPVDRTTFKCICVRAHFGGPVLSKIPVDSARASEEEEEEEDPTFCEVCGRSDREDRLLLCDGCDAGYHMECLEPPLQEVPVDEWFCPECATPEAAASTADADHLSEEEVSLLLADVVPTASRLRPRMGRTRAIARTRQSERVRATVNRNRMSTARGIQRVPRHLMSPLLDEAIEAVASGLSTAVYQRPTTPRAPAKRRRKRGRRKKVLGRKKTQHRPAGRSRGSGARSKRRQGRMRKSKGQKRKNEVTVRRRIARTLGLQRPMSGACVLSVHKPAEPSLGMMRADVGVAPLSLFGDPYELDPFDRRGIPATGPEPEVDETPVPDLLGSILSGQSLLLMDSSDVTIHRDGSLSTKQAAPASFQRNSVGPPGGGEGPGPGDSLQPGVPHSGCLGSPGSRRQGRPTPSCVPVLTSGAVVRPESSVTPQSGRTQNVSDVNSPGSKRRDPPQLSGNSKLAFPLRSASKTPNGTLPSKSAGLGQAPKAVPRRADISELPRIPKIKRDGSGSTRGDAAPAPERGQRVEIPSSCISRLTGREGPGQPGLNTRAEGEPSGRGPQEPSVHSRGGTQPPAPLGPSRGKGGSSTFQSFRINIPGNTAHPGRLTNPGFCNTFRPVDSKAQRKESPTPLFSLRKAKQLKSEIYDPFDPTGSDSSSAGSSPERLGPSLLPSEITRTIAVASPQAPPLQAVRCVTSYTVEACTGTEPEPPRGPSSSMLRIQGEGPPDRLGEEGPLEGRGPATRAQRPSPQEPWEDEDLPPRSTFFGSEERMVTCVTVGEPDIPPTTTHRVVELRSPPCSRSRSRSTSSSRSRKKAGGKQAPAREHGRPRSGSCSRSGSHSRNGSSRSASPLAAEDHTKRPRPKARSRRSSSERSSSHERAKRRQAPGREPSRGSWGPGRRRSRSGSPRSSSLEHHDSRRRKRRRSGSRARAWGCSPPSSLERARRPHRARERSRERPRDRRGSRERRRHRFPSAEHRSREHRRPRSHEKRLRPRSPERKLPVKGASPVPPPQEDPPARAPTLAGADVSLEVAEADKAPPKATPAPAGPAQCPPEDLDYGDSVEAGHVFDDFPSEGVFMQLDDMSSPPSPESTDSSPERAVPPKPTVPPEPTVPPKPTVPPASQQQDASLAMAVIRREVSLIHGEDIVPTLPWTEGPQDTLSLQQDSAKAVVGPGTLGGPSQAPGLRAKAPGKRVTWNLQEAAGGAPAEDRAPWTPLHRLQQPREQAWETEDGGPMAAPQQAPLPEPSVHGLLLPEPGFPDADTTQVYSPNLPPAPVLPSSVPPYAPVSQPTPQFILQGSLPLAGCWVTQSPAPVPTVLTTASEPAGQAAATNNSDERTAAARPAADKAKNEEYMKKLQVQERAVEEVKLAIKPFYQKREVTKDEYKDILRKAVQKICHSKSGEINPVKVGNLVRAYVDKYRHMRKHRRPEASEEPPAPSAEG